MPTFLWLGSTAINIEDIVSWEDVPAGEVIPGAESYAKKPVLVVYLRHGVRRPWLVDTQRENFLAWAKTQRGPSPEEAP